MLKEECFIRFPNTEKWFEKIRHSIRGVWKSEEKLFCMFDIAYQIINNSWRNSKHKPLRGSGFLLFSLGGLHDNFIAVKVCNSANPTQLGFAELHTDL